MPARLTDITMTRRRLIVAGSGVWLLAGSRALGAGDFWNRKPPSDWSDEEIRQLRTKSPWAKKLRVEMGGSANGPSSMDHDGSTGTFGGMHGADSNGISVSRRGAASGMGTNPGGPQAPEVTVRWESAKPMLEATGLQLPTVFENQYAISVTDLPPALLVMGMARAQASEKAMVQHLLDATRKQPACWVMRVLKTGVVALGGLVPLAPPLRMLAQSSAPDSGGGACGWRAAA
jgi:hypothetical protein